VLRSTRTKSQSPKKQDALANAFGEDIEIEIEESFNLNTKKKEAIAKGPQDGPNYGGI
jgi:hypothetical protein